MSKPHHDTPAESDLFGAIAFDEAVGDGEIPDSVSMVGEMVDVQIVEYAPGEHAALFGRELVPKYGVVRFERTAKNEYRPRFVGWGKMISLYRFFREKATGNEPHPMLQKLGLDLCYNSILRLYKNGFIKGCMPVPHRILIDLESLNRHLQEASDPEFWTPERVKRFKETIY